MGLIDLLILLVVAAVCGGLGQRLAGASRQGCMLTMVVGFIGALVGVWLKGLAGLPEPLMLKIGGSSFPVVWSIIGSALFVAVISYLSGKRK
jgi:uncharacterized membrane protein YeaQ/YmgE (transglycosylase-associated protein family)